MLTKAQKEQVTHDHVDQRSKGRLPGSYTLEFIPAYREPSTACWRWSSDESKHIIQINENVDVLMDRTIEDRGISVVKGRTRRSVPYGGNYAVSNKRHEDAHSLWTDGDFTKLQKQVEALASKKRVPVPPFGRFNLFEDARIEDLYRRTFKTKFNWMRYEFSYLERTTKTKLEDFSAGDVYIDMSSGFPEYRVATDKCRLEVPAAEPVSHVACDGLFHALIQLEKNGKLTRELETACSRAAQSGSTTSYGPYKNRFTGGKYANAAYLFRRILHYYRKACRTESTEELASLMVAYHAEFLTDHDKSTSRGKPTKEGGGEGPRSTFDPRKGDKHGKDWEEAVEEAEKRGALGTSEDGEKEAKGRGEKPKEKGGSKPDEGTDTKEAAPTARTKGGEFDTAGSLSTGSSETFYESDPKEVGSVKPNPKLAEEINALAPCSGHYDDKLFSKRVNPLLRFDRVKRMVPVLDKALRGGIKKENTMSPRRRLNVRGIVRNSPRIFRGKIKSPDGKKKLMLIYDCSGSMSGHPHNEGLVLLGAINELHRRGRVEARVFFTYGPHFEIKMPFNNDLLFHLNVPGGCEGIKNTLVKNDSCVRDSDLVICYTDGAITDAPINLKYWKERNMPSIGIYCGSAKTKDRKGRTKVDLLSQYFTHSLIRESSEELLDGIAKLIRWW